ncbi:TPA: hypothetical protein ACGO1T_001024 [Streptococcus suis]
MSNVVKSFKDKQDGLRLYLAGVDTYVGPRVAELSKLGYLSDVIDHQNELEIDTDLDSLTKAELTELAKEKAIEIPAKATKAEIIELLK